MEEIKMEKAKQTIANQKWEANNKEYASYLKSRSSARSFIKNKATVEDLEELIKLIKNRDKKYEIEWIFQEEILLELNKIHNCKSDYFLQSIDHVEGEIYQAVVICKKCADSFFINYGSSPEGQFKIFEVKKI